MAKKEIYAVTTAAVQPHDNLDSTQTASGNVIRSTLSACQRSVRLLLSSGKVRTTSEDGRLVPVTTGNSTALIDSQRGQPYISNAIRSSRYTIWDFLPKQLFFQATRLHNFYFICIGVPQTIPGISTTGNYTTILPLIFFILLTVLKEAYDDWRRHRLDEIENSSLVSVLRDNDSQARRPYVHSVLDTWLRRLGWRTGWQSPTSMESVEANHDSFVKPPLGWYHIQWRNLRVGDIIRIERDQAVPADIVLLHSGGEDRVAYIETMALDGETNLKSRQAPQEMPRVERFNDLQEAKIEFLVENPNPDLYSFDGKMSVNGKSSPVTLNEVILRASVLRNTPYIVGLIVNTGEECKIRMNANKHPQAKKPRLEKFANQAVATLIAYVILLSGGLSLGYCLWQHSTEHRSWYITDAPVGYHDIIIGYAIMFNNVIPLALYVSLEIVKLGQMYFINCDLEMFDEKTDTPMRCNTNTILEDLGQVEYVLTDKTGTLTENIMQFRKMSFAGTSWLHRGKEKFATHSSPKTETSILKAEKPDFEAPRIVVDSPESGDSLRTDNTIGRTVSTEFEQNFELVGNSESGTTHELVSLMHRSPREAIAERTKEFLLALALCHTCLPERKLGHTDFQAASPDELALVRAARDLGVLVCERSAKSVTLRHTDTNGRERDEVYDILDIVEFSNTRKRMSIILRKPDSRIWLICKGADDVLLPRLKESNLAQEKQKQVRKSSEIERIALRKSIEIASRPSLGSRISQEMSTDLRRLSAQSARYSATRSRSLEIVVDEDRPRKSLTILGRVGDESRNEATSNLLLPYSTVDRSEEGASNTFERCFRDMDRYAEEGLRTLVFAQRHLTIEEYCSWKSKYDEAKTSLNDRQNRIEAVGELVEHSLNLLGVTAVEDRLQVGVADAIERLRRANIKVWMLTGDKRETAISIAHSARVCRRESDIFTFDVGKGRLEQQIDAAMHDLSTGSVHSVVVVDGNTLGSVEGDPTLKSMFYKILLAVDSVICCRASPAQKASIVRIIKSLKPESITLAIGDGSNDIAMIQAAHLGVGISGVEGLQAYRAADFSIAQFRFLSRLLLVHGRYSYRRTARFILLTFWKEMFFYTMQALYQRYNGYTGTSLYESWSLTVLNTLFTSLCVIVPAVWDKDLRATTLIAIPELYKHGQSNRDLNLWSYGAWQVGAVISGVLIWFVCLQGFGLPSLQSRQDLFAFGDLVFSVAILWTNIKLLLIETHNRNIIVGGAFLVTVAGWWAWNIFMSSIYDTNNREPYDVRGGFLGRFGKDASWWLSLTASIMMLALCELLWWTMKLTWQVSSYSQGVSLWLRRGARGLGWSNNDDLNEVNVRIWQELEKDSKVSRKLDCLSQTQNPVVA